MEDYENQREKIVEHLEELGYIKSPEIKEAMMSVKRELFVPKEFVADSYIDTPLQIPGGGTISAPHMHAISLSALMLKKGDKFLEVGTGSGILLAYAYEIIKEVGKVFGIEIVKEAFDFAEENLKKSGHYDKVKLILGDGSLGLPDEAPFDKILVSAAAPDFPKPLVEQLKEGGIIVSMIGKPYGDQDIVFAEKKRGKLKKKNLGGVIFVPLRGRFGYQD